MEDIIDVIESVGVDGRRTLTIVEVRPTPPPISDDQLFRYRRLLEPGEWSCDFETGELIRR